jgi:hypothetical protein
MSGELGLYVSGMSTSESDDISFDTGDGFLLAHDIVEHVNGIQAVGSVGDELMALGALWYVRGDWGWPFRETSGSPELGQASDISSMYRDWLYKGWGMPTPKLGRSVFRGAFIAMLKLFPEYLEHGMETDRESARQEFSKIALRFLCRGASKAHRKYGSVRTANEFFFLVQQQIKNALAPDMHYAGQEWRLSYTFSKVTSTELSDHEFY